MSRNQYDGSQLSNKEQELVAIGAAVASNCVPCVEYHIPQARKEGLTDKQIREAIALADKVRKVPAEKVLKTAHARLATGSSVGAGVAGDRLDLPCGKEDNEGAKTGCGGEAGNTADECGSGESANEEQPAGNQTGFDFSKMMEMMQTCCPDKMKEFSSRMAGSEEGCCSSEEEAGSKKSD